MARSKKSFERPAIVRRVADPVHGTIGLTALECRIIDTPVFQRLRRVKHLGLASNVFPSADFSRFSHSLGVCHVAGQLLDALSHAAIKIEPEQWQLYRLAGLLHDIGHYPMSHALETPIKDVYGQQSSDSAFADSSQAAPRGLTHEELGGLILREDSKVREILASASIQPEEVSDLFNRVLRVRDSLIKTTDPLTNLVSSDLDADRIDYLQRTARHTGLPYGTVDFQYLLSQLVSDRSGRICLHERALRTADHFLLCRYFDAQQVAFHKTVAAMEHVLKDVVRELLLLGEMRLDEQTIATSIREGRWSRIDDPWLDLELLKARSLPMLDEVAKAKAYCVTERKPPKLIWSDEELIEVSRQDGDGKSNDADDRHERKKSDALAWMHQTAEHFNISPEWFVLWEQKPFRLTKVERRFRERLRDEHQQSWKGREKAQDKEAQVIRILQKDSPDGRPITEVKSSLMSVLSGQALSTVRLYVMDTPEISPKIGDIKTLLRNTALQQYP